MKLRALLAVATAAAALTGCGTKAADLFIVNRGGSTPHAQLTMLVNEEGNVNCNGGPTLKLSDPQLVTARTIQEETQQAASSNLSLPPQPGSVLHYYLREEGGSIRFSDNSAGQPAILRQLQLFVVQVAQQVCHLPE